jgi:hypothetical protein
MPYASRQRRELYDDDPEKQYSPFVHYTSADAALKIISSKRLWMRNATCMADYREVQHGFDILNRFFLDETKKKPFADALDACAQGATQEAIGVFNKWWRDIRLSTYITSISKHDRKEDSHGRLSMWRAFGGNSPRVAIVLNVPRFSGGSLALKLLFSPVAYLTEDKVQDVIREVTENVCCNRDFLRSVGREQIVNYVFLMLLAAVTCLKHEGFREEQEWRAVYIPSRMPSPLMEFSTEVIAGIPQRVFKIPLDGTKDSALAGLEFSRMFDRLIIGPSPYGVAMGDAFVAALEKAGVPNASSRICLSGIPIRF